MKNALQQLINNLDTILETDEEVRDTAVREAMYEAVHKAFIVPQEGYKLPEKFEMFSPEGNQMVRMALMRFLAHPEVLEAAQNLNSPTERLDSFQDIGVVSSEGNSYDEYFGYAEAP